MQGHEPKPPENTFLKGEMEAEAPLVGRAAVGAKGWSRAIICPQQSRPSAEHRDTHSHLFKERCPSFVLSVESLIIPQSL